MELKKVERQLLSHDDKNESDSSGEDGAAFSGDYALRSIKAHAFCERIIMQQVIRNDPILVGTLDYDLDNLPFLAK